MHWRFAAQQTRIRELIPDKAVGLHACSEECGAVAVTETSVNNRFMKLVIPRVVNWSASANLICMFLPRFLSSSMLPPKSISKL